MDIYIDVLIVINCYVCWLALSLTATLTHTYISAKLKTIATLFGGASSLLILLTSESTLHTVLISAAKLLSLIAIVLIAFYKRPIKKYITVLSVYLAVNLLIGGVAYLLNTIFGKDILFIKNGIVYFDISFMQLILTTAAVYTAITVISRIYDKVCDKNRSYKIEFTLCDNTYMLSAVADTGNTATDIFSGKPVVICTGIKLYSEDSTQLPIPIPYNTISGEGILYAIKPDSIFITDESNYRQQVNALVAGVEADSRGQRAIFNPKILN